MEETKLRENLSYINEIASATMIFLILFFLIAFLGLGLFFFFCYWLTNRRGSVSLYAGGELVAGTQISFEAMQKAYQFILSQNNSSNPVYDFEKAAVCRSTGRIFPSCINCFGIVCVSWDFIEALCPGKWQSWGSLSLEQKKKVWEVHKSLDGFQAERSSPQALPKQIESYYASLKPGPLYVDLESKNLAGWKCVPDTNLEVFIVQKAKVL